MKEKIIGALTALLLFGLMLAPVSAANVDQNVNVGEVLNMELDTNVINYNVNAFGIYVDPSNSVNIYNRGNVPFDVYIEDGASVNPGILYNANNLGQLSNDPSLITHNNPGASSILDIKVLVDNAVSAGVFTDSLSVVAG